jgi:hypothetical protein
MTIPEDDVENVDDSRNQRIFYKSITNKMNGNI